MKKSFLLKTTDGGKNWQTQPLNIRWATGMYFADAQKGLIGTTTGLSSTVERISLLTVNNFGVVS